MRAEIICLLTATYLYYITDCLLAIIASLLTARCASRGIILRFGERCLLAVLIDDPHQVHGGKLF